MTLLLAPESDVNFGVLPKPSQNAPRFGMLHEQVNDSVATPAQAGEVVCGVVLPISVDVVDVDLALPGNVGDVTENAFGSIPSPGFDAADAVSIEDSTRSVRSPLGFGGGGLHGFLVEMLSMSLAMDNTFDGGLGAEKTDSSRLFGGSIVSGSLPEPFATVGAVGELSTISDLATPIAQSLRPSTDMDHCAFADSKSLRGLAIRPEFLIHGHDQGFVNTLLHVVNPTSALVYTQGRI